MLSILKGKKTYLIALIAAIVIFLEQIGVLDYSIGTTLLKILGVTGLATLRAGITKAEKK